MARIESTMQDVQLSLTHILRHGEYVHGKSLVLTYDEAATRTFTFADTAKRTRKLANALRSLGIQDGDRVGTFAWNNQEHLEAYFAIPCMSAVLHTLNIRLFPEQLDYVIRHADDQAIIFDATVTPLLARAPEALAGVKHLIAIGKGDFSSLGREVIDYEELISGQSDEFEWPEIEERQAAAMCYTSGTTGNPKGVVYSHRSAFLHSLAATSGSVLAMSESDRALVIVPMFHVNAWGVPYAGWFAGSDLLFPGRYLQPPYLAKMIAQERPTLANGVPTIWNDLLRLGEETELDLSSLRSITGGGSAVPRSMMEAFQERYGVPLIQGWGMTETSPLCSVALPPKGTPPEKEMDYRAKTGRLVGGVELRIVGDDGSELPKDGIAVGEFEVRGPWITGSYFGDPSPDRFHDGWLRTGDVGTLDPEGFMQITDRTKDVIKSGGEWISSVELENEIMSHPSVFEAAVVAVPDDRWQERPLACIVLNENAKSDQTELTEYLSERVSKWWLPERWAFVSEIPKTSVGKFDKKVLRAKYANDELDVITIEP